MNIDAANLASIFSNVPLSQAQPAGAVSLGGDNDGDQIGSTGATGAAGGRRSSALLGALAATLSQLGLPPATNATNATNTANTAGSNPVSGPSATGNDSTGSSPTGGSGETIQQALAGFMYALYQAVGHGGHAHHGGGAGNGGHADGDGGGVNAVSTGAAGSPTSGASVIDPAASLATDSATTTPASGAYGGFATRLDALIVSLSSAAAPNGTAATAQTNLSTAYDNLMQALGAASSGDSSSTPPNLAAFLTALEQNLASTADAPPSSIGNVVSTSA